MPKPYYGSTEPQARAVLNSMKKKKKKAPNLGTGISKDSNAEAKKKLAEQKRKIAERRRKIAEELRRKRKQKVDQDDNGTYT